MVHLATALPRRQASSEARFPSSPRVIGRYTRITCERLTRASLHRRRSLHPHVCTWSSSSRPPRHAAPAPPGRVRNCVRDVELQWPNLKFVTGFGARQLPNRGDKCLEYVRQHATQGDAQSVVDAMDEFAYTKTWMMNIGDVKGAIVDAEIEKAKPQVMAEIGAFCGYSAVRFASKLRAVSGPLHASTRSSSRRTSPTLRLRSWRLRGSRTS